MAPNCYDGQGIDGQPLSFTRTSPPAIPSDPDATATYGLTVQASYFLCFQLLSGSTLLMQTVAQSFPAIYLGPLPAIQNLTADSSGLHMTNLDAVAFSGMWRVDVYNATTSKYLVNSVVSSTNLVIDWSWFPGMPNIDDILVLQYARSSTPLPGINGATVTVPTTNVTQIVMPAVPRYLKNNSGQCTQGNVYIYGASFGPVCLTTPSPAGVQQWFADSACLVAITSEQCHL